MATRPQGAGFVGDISDDDLDAAIDDAFDDDETPADSEPTDAPELVVSAPSSDDTADPADSDTASAGDAPPEPVAAAHPTPEVASAPAAPVVGKPFQFKASGKDHSLPWASELPDGSVVIPKEQQTEFRRELAHGRELQANFRNLQRESDRRIREAQTQRTQKDAEADAVIAWGAELAQLSPEALYERLSEFKGQIPQYQLDLRQRQLDERARLIEQQQKGPQLSVEEQQEQFTEQVQGELDATLTQLEQHETFKALSPEDRQTLRARYANRPELLVRRATEDMPQAGIAKGDVLFDPSHLVEDAKFLLQHRKPTAPSSTAAARNAALNADRQTPVNPIPPSVRQRTPVGPPRNGNGQFKKLRPGSREYKQYMMSKEDEGDDE